MKLNQADTYEAPTLTVLGDLAGLTQDGLILLGDLTLLGTGIP
jgi:hypothetical protein